MIQGRDDLDLDWDVVYAEAGRTGTVLEMNGSDHRLDLSDERARRALEAGCLLSLDSDAHRTEELHYLDWAVAQARRAWVPPERVLEHPIAERPAGVGRRQGGAACGLVASAGAPLTAGAWPPRRLGPTTRPGHRRPRRRSAG